MRTHRSRQSGLLTAVVVAMVLSACGTQTPTEEFTLTVAVAGSGVGTVTSVPAGILVQSGDSPAAADWVKGTEVTLTATAASGSVFAGWSGACSGTGACDISIDADVSVTATFNPAVPEVYTLSVSVIGNGEGSVQSTPAGIDLAAGELSGSADFNDGTVVVLTATPVAGSIFAGWSGACVGLATCVVDLDADASVTAEFGLDTEVATLTFDILAGSDDAEEFLLDVNLPFFPAGSVQLDSSDLDLTYDTAWSSRVYVGLRYGNVTIPQGAVITSASITFTTIESRGSVTLSIGGHAADDAGTFIEVDDDDPTNYAVFDISGRPQTAAKTTWVSDTAWGATASTPNLAAVVQEVVGRAGWTSGNALAFIISSDDSDTNNFRRAQSFETSGGTAPQLSITYYAPPAP